MKLQYLYYTNWLFIFYTASSLLFPAVEFEENQFWGSIEINKDVIESLNFEVTQQIRYKGDRLVADKNLTDLSLSYDINSKLKFSSDYRYAKKDEKIVNRFGLNLRFDPDINYLIPSYKIKFQNEYNAKNELQEFVIRNKITFKFPIYAKMKSNLYYESYYIDENSRFNYKKYRLSAALEYDFNSKQTLELFYIYKEEMKKKHIEISGITGLKFEYSF